MKKIAFLSFVVLQFSIGCNTPQLESNENVALDSLTQTQLTDLQRQNSEKDSAMNQAIRYLNEIEESLAEVKRKEGIISTNTGEKTEVNDDMKTKIVDDIQFINGLMEKNKNKITELRKLLKSKDLKINELEKMIANMALTLEEKDAQIAALKDQLGSLKIEYKLLTIVNEEQAQLISMQTSEINKVFYCYGTSKELIANSVITKEGGFIGLGKSETLTKDFNQRYFTQVDKTQFTTIDLKVKKAKVITSHPSDSYKLEGTEKSVDKLIITNPDKFWDISNYLVIVVIQ